jgi:arylsulfatase A-like enzyme
MDHPARVKFLRTVAEDVGAEPQMAQLAVKILRTAGVAEDDLPRHDGIDLRSLFGPGSPPVRDLHVHFPGYLEASAQRGTWRTTPGASIRRGDLKLIQWFEDDRVELYDLASDPGETRDLSGEQPERVRELLDAMAAWRRSVDAPMPATK